MSNWERVKLGNKLIAENIEVDSAFSQVQAMAKDYMPKEGIKELEKANCYHLTVIDDKVVSIEFTFGKPMFMYKVILNGDSLQIYQQDNKIEFTKRIAHIPTYTLFQSENLSLN